MVCSPPTDLTVQIDSVSTVDECAFTAREAGFDFFCIQYGAECYADAALESRYRRHGQLTAASNRDSCWGSGLGGGSNWYSRANDCYRILPQGSRVSYDVWSPDEPIRVNGTASSARLVSSSVRSFMDTNNTIGVVGPIPVEYLRSGMGIYFQSAASDGLQCQSPEWLSLLVMFLLLSVARPCLSTRKVLWSISVRLTLETKPHSSLRSFRQPLASPVQSLHLSVPSCRGPPICLLCALAALIVALCRTRTARLCLSCLTSPLGCTTSPSTFRKPGMRMSS